jgi:nicotinate-nucleotide adenylyltransferase
MAHLRIGVMGGSFDPIHLGHLVAASEACHRFRLDRVVFSPTGEPWHKAAPGASAEMRYLMTVAATADDPRFEVTRVDVDRPGPTYTVDTLRDLQAQFAAAQPGDSAEWFFITGADALADIVGWRDPDGVLARAHLVGVTRPGHVLKDPGLPAGSATLIEVPALAISSTDIRARVARSEPIAYLVPDAVARLIAEHGLYSPSARIDGA